MRLFHPDGRIQLESPRRAGEPNGTEYQWDDEGQLRSALPYLDGLEHGISRQWAPDGSPLGTYELRHGTGLDLWRGQREDGSPYLAEARFVVSGQRHGYEWLIDDDQRSVHREARYAGGLEHGIRREWNATGQLREGHPRYYLLDREVDRDEYEYGRSIDPDLPAYDAADDQPARRFPAPGRRAPHAVATGVFPHGGPTPNSPASGASGMSVRAISCISQVNEAPRGPTPSNRVRRRRALITKSV